MKKDGYNVAIAGATGAVGRTFIEILEERNFPVKNIKYLASSRSAGTYLEWKGEDVMVEELKEDSFEGIDIALFSAGGGTSTKFAPFAAKSGAVVVDNSSAWRMDDEVPLVVPEINPEDVAQYTNKGIIANPNCSTIQMVVPLKPIHDKAKIKRIVVSTYQATSGAGQSAMNELHDQTVSILNGRGPTEPKKFPHQIAFNAIPRIDVVFDDGYTKEEVKMVNETKKIMHDNSIEVTATCVRIPVFYGHSESVNIETEKNISPDEVRELLSNAPGIVVQDEPKKDIYPLAIESAGTDPVYVGRIRKDFSIPNGINMWVVADNIRKGAALNAIQIAEVLIEKYL